MSDISVSDWVVQMFHSLAEAEIAVSNIKDGISKHDFKIEISEFKDEIKDVVARFVKRANGLKARAKNN
jgi:hypothetical protein